MLICTVLSVTVGLFVGRLDPSDAFHQKSREQTLAVKFAETLPGCGGSGELLIEAPHPSRDARGTGTLSRTWSLDVP